MAPKAGAAGVAVILLLVAAGLFIAAVRGTYIPVYVAIATGGGGQGGKSKGA